MDDRSIFNSGRHVDISFESFCKMKSLYFFTFAYGIASKNIRKQNTYAFLDSSLKFDIYSKVSENYHSEMFFLIDINWLMHLSMCFFTNGRISYYNFFRGNFRIQFFKKVMELLARMLFLIESMENWYSLNVFLFF